MAQTNKKTLKQSTGQRKTYTPPKLTCFGKVASLTKTNNSKVGNPDGGGSKWNKTGL
jgi:hypothetical protein